MEDKMKTFKEGWENGYLSMAKIIVHAKSFPELQKLANREIQRIKEEKKAIEKAEK